MLVLQDWIHEISPAGKVRSDGKIQVLSDFLVFIFFQSGLSCRQFQPCSSHIYSSLFH